MNDNELDSLRMALEQAANGGRSNADVRACCADANDAISAMRARVAELEARIAELQPMAECATIMAFCGYFSRMRGPDDVALEALQTLRGIAGVTARAWELPRQDFIDEFLPWAQSRARYAVAKIEALLAAKAKGES